MNFLSIDVKCRDDSYNCFSSQYNVFNDIKGRTKLAFFDDDLYFLINEKLYLINSEHQPELYRFEESVLKNAPIVEIRSNYGVFFLITKSGELFAKGKSDKGQCGVISNVPLKKFTKISLLPSNLICPHGVKCGDSSNFSIVDVACTQSTVYILDSKSQVWSYSNGKIVRDKTGEKIEANKVPFPKPVKQISCGKTHCIALVQATSFSQSEETGELKNLESTTSLNLKNCLQCLEDDQLRLSVLMREADRQADEGGSVETLEQSPFETLLPDGNDSHMQSPSTSASNLTSHLTRFKWHFSSPMGILKRSPETPKRKLSNKLKNRQPTTTWHTNSLPIVTSTPKSTKPKPKKGSSMEIELQSIPKKTSPTRKTDVTGSIHFSFVCLDNVLSSDESSLSESDFGSKRPSTSTTISEPLSDESKNAALTPNISVSEAFYEVWTWGSNELGQLGHGDTISKREPQRVKAINGPVIKISSGNDHNVVLMATGEAYVWGSNVNGQFKQLNHQFITYPMPLKLGSESSILDIDASGDTLSVIVTGHGASPTAYHFSKAHSKISNSPTIHFAYIEKEGWPLNITSYDHGNSLLLGYMPQKDEDSKHRILDSVLKVSKLLNFTKMLVQLSELSKKLHTQTDILSSQNDVSILLNALSHSLNLWSITVSRLSETCLNLLSINGTIKLQEKSDFKIQKLLQSLLTLHYAYIEGIAYRCFSDVDIGNDLSTLIERYSLEYGTESSQQYRRLKNLFHLPFEHFNQFRDTLASVTDNGVSPNFWKIFDHSIERNELLAGKTSTFFQQALSGFDKSLRKPGRLLIWCAENTAIGPKVKEISGGQSSLRNLLGKGWVLLAVFTDSIALIHKHDYILLEFPLVWVEILQTVTESQDSSNDDQLTAKILAPEYEFHVTFPNGEMKNEFLQATAFWYRYTKEKSQLSFIANNNLNSLPISRFSSYKFSQAHPMYKGCSYEGSWRNGLPHGSGHIIFPEGKEYTGRFISGIIEGIGEMKVSKAATASTPLMSSVFFTEAPTSLEDDRFDIFKGKFKNGKLHGLSSIIWSTGDTFEGYCKNGQPHGHGVYRSVGASVGQQFYVGAFENGVKHGYGVLSTNKERYLGMWFDDFKHGKGCLITIDGIYHEGIFEKNRFLRGRVLYQPNDDELPVCFEGEFEKIGVISGKGILKPTPFDQVEGTMYGNIQSGDIKISNGTYTRIRKKLDSTAFEHDFIDEKPIENQWAVPAELKWSEIFQQFLIDDLGIENGQNFSNFEETTDEEGIKLVSAKAWDRLVGNLSKIKIQKNTNFDDRLERIPDPSDAQWSSSYYAMIAEFWHLSISNSYHPLNRLVQGLIEIFCCSYNNIGTHSVLYDSAVFEFQSLIKRMYDIMRYLFIKLPSTHDMYTPVPNRPDFHHDSDDSASTSSTAETLSLNSLQNLANYNDEEENNGSPTSSLHSSVNSPDDFSVATPCCDFIINYLFSQCYAEIFTMYSVRLEENDKKYWERVIYLNASTDSKLLTYLGVKQNLWPIDPENTKELDSFMVRVTAKKKFYESAIQTLQRLSGEFNPSSKLAILAETFSEISAFSSVGRSRKGFFIWTSDDLFPAFMYVVVRAQLQHLGAEIRLISDFCPQLNGAGQIELMFTMLRASYVQICSEKSMP